MKIAPHCPKYSHRHVLVHARHTYEAVSTPVIANARQSLDSHEDNNAKESPNFGSANVAPFGHTPLKGIYIGFKCYQFTQRVAGQSNDK